MDSFLNARRCFPQFHYKKNLPFRVKVLANTPVCKEKGKERGKDRDGEEKERE